MPHPEHIPLELLQTFAMIAECDGNAAIAAERLGITQPGISKRLSALRRATSDPDGQPWLILKGRRWRVTPEGQRVRGVVNDLVMRYEHAEQFIRGDRTSRPVVSLACGQQAASGFVRRAVKQFLQQHRGCSVRISSPRGKTRIEGTAGGQFDLAIVTDSPITIQRVARREMFVEDLFEDRFILAGQPSPKSIWAEEWNALPAERPVSAKAIMNLPFVLPEGDASRRRQFDEWMFRATTQRLDAVLEVGGWQTILDYVEWGLGVGLVSMSAVDAFRERRNVKLTTRLLSEHEFPKDAVRLIARKQHGKNEPDLTEWGEHLREALKMSIDQPSK